MRKERCGDMLTVDLARTLTRLFSELVDGANDPGGAFMLNSGDVGLLQSLDKLSAAGASRSVNGGATTAAHAQHRRYGRSPRDRGATDGGQPRTERHSERARKSRG